MAVDSLELRRRRSAACPSSSPPLTSSPARSTAARCTRRRRQRRGARHGRVGHRRRRLQAVGTATLPVPLTVLKHYRTPAFVGRRTLAFALSYSGDTEETLEMARGAPRRRARSSAVSQRRGARGARGRAGARCTCRAQRASRCRACALGRSSPASGGAVPAWACCPRRTRSLAEGPGAAPAPARRVQARRRPSRNPARELARASAAPSRSSTAPAGSAGSRPCGGSARSTRTPRRPAFWNVIPELDHNEVCGWGQHGDVTRQVFTLIELHHGLEHPRLERRVTPPGS